LFVNDGSRDATLEVLQSLTRENPQRFKLLDLPHNGGKAEAVRQGILKALDDQPDHVGFTDADLATPLEECLRLIDVLTNKRELAMALGVRLPLAGHNIQRRPIRRWIGRGFAKAASLVLGVAVADTQCGAKFFPANEFTRYLFSVRFSSKWLFDVEILARLLVAHGKRNARSRFYELPLDQWREVPGSKLKPRDFVRAVWELAAIYGEYFLLDRWKDRCLSPASVEPAALSIHHQEQGRRAA
jgi:glycosyltransferase involved in cell wall biosynthesis